MAARMHVTVDRQQLVDALALTSGVAERKTTLSPISAVLMEAEGDHLRLRATNMATFVTARIPAEVESAGQACVNAKTFHDVVRSLSSAVEQVVLEISSAESVELRGGKSLFRLRSFDPSVFPTVPECSVQERVSLSGPLLGVLIRKVFFSISSDEMKPQMNAALIESEGSLLRMVTTDGHRLTKAEVDTGGSGDLPFGQGILVPRKSLAEVRRLAEGQEEVSLAVDGSYLFLQAGFFEMAAKLLREEFPPYREVIPTDLDRKVVVERLSLLDAIKRVSLLSSEDTHGVRFHLTPGKMEVVASNPDLGEAREELEADYEGNEFQVVFNARYFVEILSEMESEEVVVNLGEDLDPCLLHGVDDPGYLGVIMPLRF